MKTIQKPSLEIVQLLSKGKDHILNMDVVARTNKQARNKSITCKILKSKWINHCKDQGMH